MAADVHRPGVWPIAWDVCLAHAAIRVVLPKPAGAETRVRRQRSPTSKQANRWGRATKACRVGGMIIFVVKSGRTIKSNLWRPPRKRHSARLRPYQCPQGFEPRKRAIIVDCVAIPTSKVPAGQGGSKPSRERGFEPAVPRAASRIASADLGAGDGELLADVPQGRRCSHNHAGEGSLSNKPQGG